MPEGEEAVVVPRLDVGGVRFVVFTVRKRTFRAAQQEPTRRLC